MEIRASRSSWACLTGFAKKMLFADSLDATDINSADEYALTILKVRIAVALG